MIHVNKLYVGTLKLLRMCEYPDKYLILDNLLSILHSMAFSVIKMYTDMLPLIDYIKYYRVVIKILYFILNKN